MISPWLWKDAQCIAVQPNESFASISALGVVRVRVRIRGTVRVKGTVSGRFSVRVRVRVTVRVQ